MTEVIGWDDDRSIRRTRRWPWVLLALAVALAVAAPTVNRWWGEREARWLAGRWATAQAYDYARITALTKVADRAVSGDEPVLTQAVRNVDREQAAALQRIADQVRRRRLLDGATRRAAAAVRDALTARADTLLQQARTWQATDYFAPPLPYDRRSLDATSRANDLVTRLGGTRKLPHRTVALHAADAAAGRLSRVIDERTGVRIVLLNPENLRVLSLDDGTVQPLGSGVGFDESPNAIVVTSRAMFLAAGHGVQVLPLDGGRTRTISWPTSLWASGARDVWLVGDRDVQRVDATGAALTPLRAVPHQWFVIGATTDGLVLDDGSGPSLRPWYWNPSTGAFHPLRGGCEADGGTLLAGGTLVVRGPCDKADRTLDVVDPASGTARTLTMPAGLYFDGYGVVSPDGSHIAVTANDPSGSTDAVVVVDLASGRLELVGAPVSLAPADWTADGGYLLLRAIPSTRSQSPLWLWRPGADHATALRVREALPGAAVLVP